MRLEMFWYDRNYINVFGKSPFKKHSTHRPTTLRMRPDFLRLATKSTFLDLSRQEPRVGFTTYQYCLRLPNPSLLTLLKRSRT